MTAIIVLEEDMLNIRKTLFPIDLDAEDISSVVTALELAKTLNSEIHILYVNDIEAGYRHPTDREDMVALRVKEVAPDELLAGQKIIYAVSKGDLDKEIVKYCKDNNIDLIIVGHKHRHKIYSALFDSPDLSIIDAVKLPVLVIPEK
jgi:nucleotide-binding universal stress UspA family protein